MNPRTGNARRPLLLVFGLLLATLLAACSPAAEPAAAPTQAPPAAQAEPTPVPPTMAPEPTATMVTEEMEPEPEGAWVADAVIGADEYAHSVEAAGVTFHWSSDDEFLFGAMSAETTGWVAVAFDPENKMQGANYVYGWVKDGQTEVFNMFGTKPAGPGSHPEDRTLGGTDDIVAFAGSEEGGTTLIEFQIPLDSGDANDKPLAAGGTYTVLLAHGANDDLNYHAARGATEITLD